VPWELVKDMDRVERAAWCIAIGEHNGKSFDWRTWGWRDQK